MPLLLSLLGDGPSVKRCFVMAPFRGSPPGSAAASRKAGAAAASGVLVRTPCKLFVYSNQIWYQYMSFLIFSILYDILNRGLYRLLYRLLYRVLNRSLYTYTYIYICLCIFWFYCLGYSSFLGWIARGPFLGMVPRVQSAGPFLGMVPWVKARPDQVVPSMISQIFSTLPTG